MFNKQIYKEYLDYYREVFNGQCWVYCMEDAFDEFGDESLDLIGVIEEDLNDFGFSAININL